MEAYGNDAKLMAEIVQDDSFMKAASQMGSVQEQMNQYEEKAKQAGQSLVDTIEDIAKGLAGAKLASDIRNAQGEKFTSLNNGIEAKVNESLPSHVLEVKETLHNELADKMKEIDTNKNMMKNASLYSNPSLDALNQAEIDKNLKVLNPTAPHNGMGRLGNLNRQLLGSLPIVGSAFPYETYAENKNFLNKSDS